ncbi:DNA (cytosine-5-)-methyltransferase [Aliarcobacter skirrowii]|uniref:DNA cytosine methyltransferase n=1 Tax=Aliarcobacter TaxID=2321111 RepID=UPI0029BB7E9B|nr:DNA (cytosine-5-)-methyltransferase [Aliarcobacter skirrowii]MDX4061712.1 DNA (cytosine-5-)-methyltransferase [Aliarcobacter skirrowii]
MKKLKISAVDLFCGIGGLSFGLKQAGIKIKAGIDFDNSCKYAYEKNCNSKFIYSDVSNIKKEDINKYFKEGEVKVLVGCAPCQPFSTYTMHGDKQKDQRWQLLYQFARLIKETEPDIISMENVPNLVNFKKEPVLDNFIKELKDNSYWVWHDIVYSPDYGIPQKRKRLVLLASRKGPIKLIEPTHKPNEYITVKDAIGDLIPIKAGETASDDFIHKASKISDKNIQRIKQSKPGGSWKTDWDEELKLECHKKESGKSYGSVYGRMSWNEPSPTMTTFCTGIGNGRFGHPEQDRAISLREAAILQSFPKSYSFVEKEENLRFGQISRQIGNAVPPKLGEVIGKSIINHLKEFK